MNFPKLVIVSDGECPGILLDGVFIGQGIKRLDFSTENKDGELVSTIRILELDLRHVSMERDTEKFRDFMEQISCADIRSPLDIMRQAVRQANRTTQKGEENVSEEKRPFE